MAFLAASAARGADTLLQSEACKTLAVLGTEKSLPALQALQAEGGLPQAEAQKAIAVIEARAKALSTGHS